MRSLVDRWAALDRGGKAVALGLLCTVAAQVGVVVVPGAAEALPF